MTRIVSPRRVDLLKTLVDERLDLGW